MTDQGDFRAWSLPEGVPDPRWLAGLSPDGSPGVPVLPEDADWIGRLADRLREGAPALRRRSWQDLVTVLGTAGSRFLDPSDPLRARALAWLPRTSGLSPEMAAAVLDGMATDWTEEALTRSVLADFPDPRVLDAFVPLSGRRARVVGPALTVQIVSGSVPGVGATALLRSLLLKGPTLVKPGWGDVVLPVLMAEAVRAVDPEVGRGVGVVYWPGGHAEVDRAALRRAEVVVAYGGDATVERLRGHTPVAARFLGYHHRISFGVVGRGSLDVRHRVQSASEVAGAVAFFDQRGCVSPQLLFVEEGGEVTPEAFAEDLAHALSALEGHLPGGLLEADEASALHQARGSAELLAASGSAVRVIHGGAASWTVVLDPGLELDVVCVGRLIRIRPVRDASEVAGLVAPFRRHLQSAAVSGLGGRLEGLAEELALEGVTRITSFDAAPFPPPGWHHDGRGALEALARWVDLEC